MTSKRAYTKQLPKGLIWYGGVRYDVALGNALKDDGYHTQVPVWIRDSTTNDIIYRVGEGKQIGNFHPVWVNFKGKKITVEKLLEKK
jgi:hypothetical protein